MAQDVEYLPTIEEKRIIDKSNVKFAMNYLLGVSAGLGTGLMFLSRSKLSQLPKAVSFFSICVVGETVGRFMGERKAFAMLDSELPADSPLRGMLGKRLQSKMTPQPRMSTIDPQVVLARPEMNQEGGTRLSSQIQEPNDQNESSPSAWDQIRKETQPSSMWDKLRKSNTVVPQNEESGSSWSVPRTNEDMQQAEARGQVKRNRYGDIVDS